MNTKTINCLNKVIGGQNITDELEAVKSASIFFSPWMDQILWASLPFSLKFSLVYSEPWVRDFLAAARKASSPADALPAGEAASADRLAPLVPYLGGVFFPRHAAGELLQGTTKRHDGIHFTSCLVEMLFVDNGVVIRNQRLDSIYTRKHVFICKYK